MERTALLTLMLGAILFLAHPVHAQSIGDRMRITTQHRQEIIGQIKSLDNTSLTILTDYSRELGIAYAEMVQLQRSHGVRSHYKKGAVIGLGIGGLAGILGYECNEIAHYRCNGSGRTAVTLILSGGGALLGLIVGAAIRTERWERVDIPSQSAASVMPVIGIHPNGSLTLGTRISF